MYFFLSANSRWYFAVAAERGGGCNRVQGATAFLAFTATVDHFGAKRFGDLAQLRRSYTVPIRHVGGGLHPPRRRVKGVIRVADMSCEGFVRLDKLTFRRHVVILAT